MDTRKLLKRISWTVIGLAFIVLFGVTVFQQQQIKSLKVSSPDHVSQNSQPAGGLANGPENAGQNTARFSKNPAATRSGELEELNYQLQATEEELDMVNEDLNKEMDRKAELARQRRELQKKQFENPSLQKFIRENIAKRISDFVKEFDISPEDAEAFAEILLAQEMASQEIFFEAREITNPTEEDRARFKQRFQDLNSEYEAKKTALLGEDVCQEYPSYERKWYIKEYQVGNFSAVLGPDESLTDGQRTALVEALVEIQEKQIKENTDKIEELKNTYTFPSETYDQKHLDEMVENMTRSNEDYVEAARSILSPSQTKKLEAYLDQDLEMMISSMKMAALEFGYSYDLEDGTDARE